MADFDRAHLPRRSAVDIRGFPGIRRLAADYAFAFDRLRPFFAGDPARPEAWERAVRDTQARPRPGAAIAGIVGRQQERRGAPAAARAAAARLADPRTIAIVTGQQAGLFGGPLYTMLKALTALALAAQVERRHDVPAVAVFWIEAEDHDWQEVGSCAVLDEHLERRLIELQPPPGAGTLPVGAVRLDDAAGRSVEDLAGTLPRTEFTESLLSGLADAYRPGRCMADAFGRWLEAALGERGLVLFDAGDPAAKPLVGDVFVRELEEPGRTARLAAEAGEALIALGYHAQVAPQADTCSLFRLGGRREAVRYGDGGFLVGATRIPRVEMLRAARHDPAVFSPNVLLRPVVQDTLFPTAAYVAGPNELAYLAQLGGVYRHFDLPMPLITPRVSLTLLDAGAFRFLARYEVPAADLGRDDEAALNRLLAHQLPASVEQAYSDLRQAVETRMEGLIGAVPAVDPTLEGAARSAHGRIRHDLDTLHGKIIQAAKRRDETLRRQFHRARALAFPGGHPQERSIGWVYFLNQYGAALVDRLAEDTPLEAGRHWVLAI